MKLHDQLGVDLRVIDATLREVIRTDRDLPASSIVRDGILKLIDAGGKRLRPIMVIVGSRFGKLERRRPVLRVAALVEYLHMASLIHDDIIDQADLRRGAPTLHTQIGISGAVLTGNYMMARVLEWAAEAAPDREPDAQEQQQSQLAASLSELCIGEYQQLHNRFNFDLTLQHYLDKTRRKTALLLALCLRAGAHSTHAEPEVAELLYQLGEALGMTFQIRDDIMDFTQQEGQLGKPVGADLRNGNITLPVLYALEEPELAQQIRALGPTANAAAFDEAIREIAASNAIERCEAMADSYAQAALALIGQLAQHPASPQLRVLAQYFLS
ncbi:polyprenyl synthetase family protein [Paenibacillus daejeonensis]|uniref:polyprenyl synthetase family protein n=1 Tax=Paenibacillus daejeonensis TaxID=135193 RepID=UPI000370684F|nr:polyprenyl synthetase family protein [Paenibacillus daejeonensis]